MDDSMFYFENDHTRIQ